MTDPVPTEAVARVAFLPRGQLLPTTLGTSGCVEAIIRVSAFDEPASVTVLFTGFATGAVEANERAIREMAAVLIGILPESEPEPRVTPVSPPLRCVVCMRQAHWKIDGTSYCRDHAVMEST